MRYQFKILIIVAVVLVVSLVPSIALYQSAQNVSRQLLTAQQRVSELEQRDQETLEESPTVSDQEMFNQLYDQEDISAWKEYRSAAFNIVFSYPPSFSISETKDSITLTDPSQEKNTDSAQPVTLTYVKGSAGQLSSEYLGFNSRVQWNPFQASTRKFSSTVAMLPHFSGDTSRYVTYFFPIGFIDPSMIPPAEADLWTREKIANQKGALIIAQTVSGADDDEMLKKAVDATNLDIYQDLPACILATLRPLK